MPPVVTTVPECSATSSTSNGDGSSRRASSCEPRDRKDLERPAEVEHLDVREDQNADALPVHATCPPRRDDSTLSRARFPAPAPHSVRNPRGPRPVLEVEFTSGAAVRIPWATIVAALVLRRARVGGVQQNVRVDADVETA